MVLVVVNRRREVVAAVVGRHLHLLHRCNLCKSQVDLGY